MFMTVCSYMRNVHLYDAHAISCAVCGSIMHMQ